jgi:hypothetical protein
MATNTILQKLDGGSDFGASTSHRRQTEQFLATLTNGGGAPAVVTLSAGTWVAFDDTKTGADQTLYVKEAANVAGGNTLVVGVVLKDASTASIAAAASADVQVEVVIAGYVASANVTTGVTAGTRVVVDTTAGRGDAAAAGEIPCGVVLTTIPAGNAGEVLVLKNF